MKRLDLALAALFIVAATPGSRADAIDNLVQTQLDKQRIPGLSIAVVRDGKIVLAKGYGLANVEHSVPVKPETVFQSGSVGKQIAATAVMMDDKLTVIALSNLADANLDDLVRAIAATHVADLAITEQK